MSPPIRRRARMGDRGITVVAVDTAFCAVAEAMACAKAAASGKRSAGTGASARSVACSTLARHARAHAAKRGDLAAHASRNHCLGGGAGERRLTGQHLVKHAGQTVLVAPGIHRSLAACLLRTHIRRSAHREPRFSESLDARCVQRPGDAEVRYERAAVLGEEQILGLDVPVNHPVVVGILERPGGVGGNPKCILHRQLRLAPQAIAEALTFDEGHGEPELPGGFPGVVNREDMRVLQAGGEPDFTLEAFGTERRRQLRVHHLQGHLAVVPEVAGQVDRGHAPAAELALEEVAVAEGVLELAWDVGQ